MELNDPEIIAVRKELVEINDKLDALHVRKSELLKPCLEIIKNEPDISKREKLIDFIFENKIDEVFEYHLRKYYVEQVKDTRVK